MMKESDLKSEFDREIVIVSNLYYRHYKHYQLNNINTSEDKNMSKWAKQTTLKKLGEKVKQLLNHDIYQIVLETSPCNYGTFNMTDHADKTLEFLSTQIKNVDKVENGDTETVKLYILSGKPVRSLNVVQQILLGVFVTFWAPIAMILRAVVSLVWAPQYLLCYLPTRFFHFAYAVTAKESVINMPTAITYGFYRLIKDTLKYPIHVLFESLWTPCRTVFRFLGSTNTISSKIFVHNLLGVFRDKLSFFNDPITAEESIAKTKEFISKIHAFNNTEPKYPTHFLSLLFTILKGSLVYSGNKTKSAGKCLVSGKQWVTFGKFCGLVLLEVLRFVVYIPFGLIIGSSWGIVSLVSNLVLGIPAFYKKSYKELCGKHIVLKIIYGILSPVLFPPVVVIGSLLSFFISIYVAVRGIRDVLVGSKDLGDTRGKAMKEAVIIMGNGFLDTLSFSYDLLTE